mmetsp:Transcript_4059/g.11900  ORF Transcript_4059/g.11900 Transcript_4059/m.11900 type:complete len:278 (+) Transcript_4059:654-1487(+)
MVRSNSTLPSSYAPPRSDARLLTEFEDHTWRRSGRLLQRACKGQASSPSSEQLSAAMVLMEPLDVTWGTPQSSERPRPRAWQASMSLRRSCVSSWALGPSSQDGLEYEELLASPAPLPPEAARGRSPSDGSCEPPEQSPGDAVPEPGCGDRTGEVPNLGLGSICSSNNLLSFSICPSLCSSGTRFGDMHSTDLERGEAAWRLLGLSRTSSSSCSSSCSSKDRNVFLRLTRTIIGVFGRPAPSKLARRRRAARWKGGHHDRGPCADRPNRGLAPLARS